MDDVRARCGWCRPHHRVPVCQAGTARFTGVVLPDETTLNVCCPHTPLNIPHLHPLGHSLPDTAWWYAWRTHYIYTQFRWLPHHTTLVHYRFVTFPTATLPPAFPRHATTHAPHYTTWAVLCYLAVPAGSFASVRPGCLHPFSQFKIC